MSIRIGDKILAGTYNAEDLLKSPSFSGVPTVPTASKGDLSKQIANTEYVQQALDAFTPPTVINLDNNSITKNASDEIQTVGVIERNKGELMCDWVGTLEEYTTQNIETEHPEWTCYITDDDVFNKALVEGSDISLLNNDKQFLTKSTALSNGFLDNSLISFGVLDYKPKFVLEIDSNRNIIIKEGSKVYLPNGFDSDGQRKFFEYTFKSDFACAVGEPTGERMLLLVCRNDDVEGHSAVVAIQGLNMFSGDTTPTNVTTQTAYWYDTANNIIKRSQDTGATWSVVSTTHYFSLPICIATYTSGKCNIISKTFDCMGYAGKHVFLLPHFSFGIPCGRNLDGTLNNNIIVKDKVPLILPGRMDTTGEVYIAYGLDNQSFYNLMDGWHIKFSQTKPITVATNTKWFSLEENMWYTTSDAGVTWTKEPMAILGRYWGNQQYITNIQLKTPSQFVRFSDMHLMANSAMPSDNVVTLTAGASGTVYKAPASGWVNFELTTASGNTYSTIINMTSGYRVSQWTSVGAANVMHLLPVGDGDKFQISYNQGTPNQLKFYYAQGEN